MYNIRMLYAEGVLIGLLCIAVISLWMSIGDCIERDDYGYGPKWRATGDDYHGWFYHLLLIGFIISAIVSL